MLSVLFLGETVDSLVLASIFCLIIGIICSIGLWKIFEKAGKPGLTINIHYVSSFLFV